MQRFEIPAGVRFITFSCEKRLPLLKNPQIANLFVERLSATRDQHLFDLFAWVVMPEHVHLLIRPAPNASASSVLRTLKASVASRVLRRWKALDSAILDRITTTQGNPRFWLAGGGFDRNVRSLTEFQQHVQYIHANPVTRGLVTSPEQWGWSSYRWWAGDPDVTIPCDAPPGDPAFWVRWTGYR